MENTQNNELFFHHDFPQNFEFFKISQLQDLIPIKYVTDMLIEALLLELFVELKHSSKSNELNSTIFSLVISIKMIVIKELYPNYFIWIFSTCTPYLLNITGNNNTCFLNLKLSAYFIWWWLSVECKLVENMKHITWIFSQVITLNLWVRKILS